MSPRRPARPDDGTADPLVILARADPLSPFYDPRYAAAQQMTATTHKYRQFYDPRYGASRQIAQTTSEYCAGSR